MHSRALQRSCGAEVQGAATPHRAVPRTAGAVFERITVLEDVTHSTGSSPAAAVSAEPRHSAGAMSDQTSGSLDHADACPREPYKTTHGLHKPSRCTPTWNGIIARCTNPRIPSPITTTAAGVSTISERWLDVAVFIADIESEIGPRPGGVASPAGALYSLDRIDNDGNYEPGNVRWGTWIGAGAEPEEDAG